jgi:hypothetical protein
MLSGTDRPKPVTGAIATFSRICFAASTNGSEHGELNAFILLFI